MTVFHEVTDDTESNESNLEKVRSAMKKMNLRPGANITVMGVGGAGGNAIRSMQEIGLDASIKLIAIDTDVGSDIERYGKKSWS